MSELDLSRWLAVPFVGAAAATLVAALVARSGGRRSERALGLVTLGLAIVAWGARWVHAGHLPLFGTYESAWSLAVATLLGAALASRARLPGAWAAGAVVAGLVVAHGMAYDPAAYPLTISERSWVVDLHAVVAWAAFAAWSLSAGLAAWRLLERTGEDPVTTDRRLTAVLSLGFLLHSAMLASGSFYKFLLFGTTWTFDPVETLGFVVWVGYGTILHLRLLAGWEGRRLAAWTLFVFALLVVSYRGIVYFPSWSTYHIFDMDLRLHLVD